MQIELRDGRWYVVGADGEVGAESYASASDAAASLESEDATVESGTVSAPLVPQAERVPIASDADAAGLVASITAHEVDVPARPPAAWFTDPQFTDVNTVPSGECGDVRGCPLTITDDGQVFGHLALWQSCHIGYEGECVNPPTSPSGYARFLRGATKLDDDSVVATGNLTVGTGHASTDARNPITASTAAAHYDNTGNAVARVAAGEDGYGIWVAGAIMPGASVAQVEALRSSALSGDWRRYPDGLDMVAALAVNVPGFPVPRYSLAASANVVEAVEPLAVESDGETFALVAAGSQSLVKMAAQPWLTETEMLKREMAELRRWKDTVAPILTPMVASAVRNRLKNG